MCAISLQYDQHNAAAVKMLEAIIAAGLFTVCPTMEPFTKEQLNAEMDQVEADVTKGRLIDAQVAHQRMHDFVQKRAQL